MDALGNIPSGVIGYYNSPARCNHSCILILLLVMEFRIKLYMIFYACCPFSSEPGGGCCLHPSKGMRFLGSEY